MKEGNLISFKVLIDDKGKINTELSFLPEKEINKINPSRVFIINCFKCHIFVYKRYDFQFISDFIVIFIFYLYF